MAVITTYATLLTAVADYLARDDLTTFTPNFLQNAEGKIYRSLRIRDMETTMSSLAVSSGVVALPTRYLSLKYAYIDGTPLTVLERVTGEVLYKKFPNRTLTGTPCLITEEAGNFIFGSVPADTAKLSGIYYQKYEALSGSNTTNWYTDNAPEVLLYGSLLEAAPFIGDDARLPVWQTLFSEAIATVLGEARNERYSGGNLSTKVA